MAAGEWSKFRRVYFVAETEDGTRYEFECENPSFVSCSMGMRMPYNWAGYDVPVESIVVLPVMSCLEASFRADGAKAIHVTKTTGEEAARCSDDLR